MPLVSRTFDQLIDFTRTSAATYVDATGKIVPTPASRNLLPFTQEFDNGVWTKGEATVAANSATAPDGTLTADKVVATTAATYHGISRSLTLTAGTAYTFSIYAKASEYSLLRVAEASGGSFYASFNLSTQSVVSGDTGGGLFVSASISNAGNGWFRCSVVFISNSTGIPLAFSGYPAGATVTPYGVTYTGDGTSGIFIWGAQLEAVPDANLVLGSELVTNGDFASGSTGWTVPAGWSIGSGVATATATNASLLSTSAVTAGKVYRVAFDVSSYTSGTLYVRVGAGSAVTVTGAGSKVVYLTATNTSGVEFYGGVVTLSLDNISVKEITGTTGMPTDYTRNNGGVYPPRFDYDPVTLAPKGLLVEEQRTNLLVRSEEFDNAAWAKSNVTVTSNAIISPDGTADADKIVDNTANTSHAPYTFSLSLSATTYTNSVYLKAGERSWAKVTIYDGASEKGAFFNLATGALGNVDAGVTASIQSVGNGWYRCIVTVTTAAGSGGVAYYIATGNGTGVPSYTGDGTSGIYIWGAQLEAGSFATSYIPTVASQVTRTADVATITGANFSQWYNQSEGTFVVEASCFGLGKSLSDGFVAATNGTAAENISIYRTGSANNVQSSIRDNNADQVTYTVALGTQPVKAALAYATNNSNSAQGGVAQTTDTTCTIPTVDRLLIGSIYAAGDYPTNGHIRSIRYYPTRLSNAQLQALTA